MQNNEASAVAALASLHLGNYSFADSRYFSILFDSVSRTTPSSLAACVLFPLVRLSASPIAHLSSDSRLSGRCWPEPPVSSGRTIDGVSRSSQSLIATALCRMAPSWRTLPGQLYDCSLSRATPVIVSVRRHSTDSFRRKYSTS